MAIVVAASMVGLLIVGAMVLDFGVIRVDKQRAKSLADTAVMAGMGAADGGTGEVYTFRAVCGALDYLRSSAELAGLPDDICAAGSLLATLPVTCKQADSLTHAAYDRSTTYGGATYRVVIKSPYNLAASGWSEESQSHLASDQSTTGGCDQLGVEIFVSRKPGLGSLASSGDLSAMTRSASRAQIGTSSSIAPALIMLERTACSAITVGAAGGGSGTFIKVYGVGNSPGSVHVDSDASGSDCGSGPNQQLYQGKQNDGIVAYGSPSPTGIAGIVSAYAAALGRPANIVSDPLNFVYGTTALGGTGASKDPVAARQRVTRTPVDQRYRQPIRDAITQASGVWDNPSGWTTTNNCSPSAADLAVTGKLWINCDGNSGFGPGSNTNPVVLLASEVYINGFVRDGNVSMPNATRVYVSNTKAGGGTINSSAINLTNNSGFCVRGSCVPAAGCPPTTLGPRARVFVRQGSVDVSGGVLRMCNSTAILLGANTATGCVPGTTSPTNAPTSTPCTTTPASGNSRIDVAGGAVLDWTAPNQYPGSVPDADQATAYGNLEDLALWSESAGLYKFSGGGGLNTVGVFMAPNGDPISVGGGGNQTLTNAQYVARRFQVSGGGTLALTTDPRNAVSVPTFLGANLIR